MGEQSMKIFIITGQTATGKTEYALQLAKKINGELINCDSRQIYKGLDIITGKDRPKGIKVWLYDIVDPKKYFSSFDWVQLAISAIKDIIGRGRTPIIVGGTYFYFYHLLYNVETQHIAPNWSLRKQLNSKPIHELQKMFQSLDPTSFARLNTSDKNNPQRLIRKIEIVSSNPKVRVDSFHIPSSFSVSKKLHMKVEIEYIGLRFKNHSTVEKNIRKRVKERIQSGAFEEVKRLLKQGYSAADPGLKTIGYAQIIRYIKGEIARKDAIEQWIRKEIQYAKRQYTFMKKDRHIRWISV